MIGSLIQEPEGYGGQVEIEQMGEGKCRVRRTKEEDGSQQRVLVNKPTNSSMWAGLPRNFRGKLTKRRNEVREEVEEEGDAESAGRRSQLTSCQRIEWQNI